MIYTSYFANIKNLPEDIVPIAICGKSPAGYKGLEYKTLAPKWSFFSKWKETQDNDYYIKHFNEEVLSVLTPDEVVSRLYDLSNGKDVCLICYEKPENFCHRHLVREWLNENGIKCEEAGYGKELRNSEQSSTDECLSIFDKHITITEEGAQNLLNANEVSAADLKNADMNKITDTSELIEWIRSKKYNE